MKLSLLSGRQVLSALSRLGCVAVHRKGSSIPMGESPFHDPVDRYTLKGALRDAGIPIADFFNEIK